MVVGEQPSRPSISTGPEEATCTCDITEEGKGEERKREEEEEEEIKEEKNEEEENGKVTLYNSLAQSESCMDESQTGVQRELYEDECQGSIPGLALSHVQQSQPQTTDPVQPPTREIVEKVEMKEEDKEEEEEGKEDTALLEDSQNVKLPSLSVLRPLSQGGGENVGSEGMKLELLDLLGPESAGEEEEREREERELMMERGEREEVEEEEEGVGVEGCFPSRCAQGKSVSNTLSAIEPDTPPCPHNCQAILLQHCPADSTPPDPVHTTISASDTLNGHTTLVRKGDNKPPHSPQQKTTKQTPPDPIIILAPALSGGVENSPPTSPDSPKALTNEGPVSLYDECDQLGLKGDQAPSSENVGYESDLWEMENIVVGGGEDSSLKVTHPVDVQQTDEVHFGN